MARRQATLWLRAILASAVLALLVAGAGPASALPEIRTHENNRVPSCVTPARLMRYLTSRNHDLAPRFRTIATFYKQHGEALRVRWDYAFFQMLLETNFLTYKTGSGRWGDVNPNQNNFAGLGTTGGGVPGDSFPDVSTGVLAQLQHLVAYSGEHVDNPAAARTRLKQDDIIEVSRKLRRPVTFRDLARRWATDRRYAGSIEAVAQRFRASSCTREAIAEAAQADDPRPPAPRARTAMAETDATRPSRERRAEKEPPFETAVIAGAAPLLKPPKPAPAARPAVCKVWTASYGGGKSVLIRANVDGEVHYTALQVLEGFEKSLSENFIRTHATGGEPIGEFDSREEALVRAFDLCPSARRDIH